MYAQVVFLDGLNCAGCGRVVFPSGRPIVAQVVDVDGHAVEVPPEGSPESQARRLVARHSGCGTATLIRLDGLHIRIERQQNMPDVNTPVYLE